MSDDGSARPKRVLDPMDRMIEAIFGLVMVLTFTCTLSTVESTRADVREMMLAAFGCNLAWGLVDGVMYLVARVSQRMRGRRLLRTVREGSPDEARGALSEALPPLVVKSLDEAGLRHVTDGLKALPESNDPRTITMEDGLGAVAIFLIAVVSVLPVLLPFALMKEVHPAMRVSNGIALLLLFLVGQQWASLIGLPRLRVGFAMALGGALLVSVTIALGG